MTVSNDSKIRTLKFGKTTFRFNKKPKPLTYKITDEGYMMLKFKSKRFYRLLAKEDNRLLIVAVKGDKSKLKKRKKPNVIFFYDKKIALKYLDQR